MEPVTLSAATGSESGADSPSGAASLLLIDDDQALCALLAEYLAREGFRVQTVHDGESGLKQLTAGSHDLAILDVMLPHRDGFEVLREARRSSAVPIIMLTARGEDIDRVVGLELGADDYLPKPFNPRELLARIRAILWRTDPRLPGVLDVSGVQLDSAQRVVSCAGMRVEVTSTEFAILAVLMRESGRVVDKDVLYRTALGRTAGPYDRTVDVHISNLRRKLGVLEDGRSRIETVRGVGYQFIRTDG